MDRAIGFDVRHCWAVVGVTAKGVEYYVRHETGRNAIRTVSDSMKHAQSVADLMNANGAKVRAIKQHLDINDLWQDS